MEKMLHLVVFRLDDKRFALPLNVIERVVQVVYMHKLPEMPDYLQGIINMYGEVIPVINMRHLFGMPQRELELSDQLIIATTASLKVALLVDATNDVIEIEADNMVKSQQIKYGIKYVQGVLKLENDMILINDIDSFLDENQLTTLREALDKLNQKSAKKNSAVTGKTENKTRS